MSTFIYQMTEHVESVVTLPSLRLLLVMVGLICLIRTVSEPRTSKVTSIVDFLTHPYYTHTNLVMYVISFNKDDAIEIVALI